jgi:hypothetical protein
MGVPSIPGPDLNFLGKPRSAFRVCGSLGLLLSAALAWILAGHAGLSSWVIAGIACTAVPTFVALVMATKIVTGEETIVYYHHEIAVLLATGLFLVMIRQPLLPYLDVTIVSLGLFLACGRIGCLLAGCCHGRPHGWGVRYGKEHAAAGFPAYLVGVRLFPVQAAEALWVLFVVAGGVAMLWRGSPPGSALAWYVVAYGLGRFALEFARGDAERPYWRGFSQPQWISLMLTASAASAELRGDLPVHAWHAGAALLLAVGMCVVAAKRRFRHRRRFRLLHPAHIREIAVGRMALLHGGGVPSGTRLFRTSLGVQLSAGEVRRDDSRTRHYSFSFSSEGDEKQAAQILAELMTRLDGAGDTHRPPGPPGRVRLVRGSRGVFHLLIEAGVAAP